MPSRTPKASLLGIFWFGIQVVWGALLGVSMQVRISELAHGHAIAAYGPIAGAGAAVAAITQITIGIISDRRRRRGSRRIEFYVAGAAIAVPALLWFYAAPSLRQLFESIVILQIGMNIAIGPYQAVIPDFIPDREIGRASSWMAALQSAGNACGALAAAFVGNLRVLALLLGATVLASCAVTASHVRSLPLLAVREEPLRITRAFVDLFISRAFVFLGFYTLLGYLFFYVRDLMPSNTRMLTGAFILLVTASAAAGATIAARPADRIDRRAVAAAGGAGFVLALVAFLFSHAFGAAAAGAVLAGLAWGVFVTADWALGCQFLPRFALATAMGMWNLALLLPQIVAPLIATALLSSLHSMNSPSAPRIAFLLAAVEVSCGIAWIWRLPSTARSVENGAYGNIP